jgi:hypothetical protein
MGNLQYAVICLCVAAVVEIRADEPIGSRQKSCDLVLPIKVDYVVRVWSQPIDIVFWIGDQAHARYSARTRWIDAERVADGKVKAVWHDVTDVGDVTPCDLTIAQGEGDTVAIAATRFERVYFRVFALHELDRSFTIAREANVEWKSPFEEQEHHGTDWFFPLQLIRERYPFAFTRSADAKAWTLRGPLPGTLRPALPVLKWEKEDMERLGLPTATEEESRPH